MSIKQLTLGLVLMAISLVSYGQSRPEKTTAIIHKLNLIEHQKQNYKYQLDPLKYLAKDNNSNRINELEKRLSENEIVTKISSAFDKVFTDSEIDAMYTFIQTSAFDKFFTSGETQKSILLEFKDIDHEIAEIRNDIKGVTEIKTDELTEKEVESLTVDREDGFYIAFDDTYSSDAKDIKLEINPSLTSADILKIKKVYSKSFRNRPEISIVLTKEGAQKFYMLTKENIGKTIAIVIDKKIISAPKVVTEIKGGKLNISGDFSENEIDEMIEKLKGK